MRRTTLILSLVLSLIGTACGGAPSEGDSTYSPSRPRHSRATSRYANETRPRGKRGGGKSKKVYAPPAYRERNEDYENMPALETLRGQASYYHDSLAGNNTANGEVYDPALFTCANRTLPFGTMLRVTRIDNGLSVIVRVNDRGPFGSKKRILDLSRAAAERLQMGKAGVTNVRVEVLKIPN